MTTGIEISSIKPNVLKAFKAPFYYILVFDGSASFSVDFTKYACEGKSLLFLSPYQFLEWQEFSAKKVECIQFHGDFYCIEYHKKEVACNGVLFNNIYQQPYVQVGSQVFDEILMIIEKLSNMNNMENEYDISIAKSYLQLILALSSKEKKMQIKSPELEEGQFENMAQFINILESQFWHSKEVSFYASKFGISVNSFSKRIKKYFGKPPSKLIQERIVLEAKKLLHLTHKSIKEIAAQLRFEDEFYFSRYFKKEVGVSPKQYREKVGISIVAKSSR